MRTSVAAVALALVGCATPPPPARGPVDALLDGWHQAAARADEKAYFDALAADSIFMGTDATERWDKAAFRAYAKKPFARGKAWTFRATRRSVAFSRDGDTAWFDEDLATENLGPARGSGVVVRRDGQWRIVHYNLTITVPNERFDEVKTLLASPPPAKAPAPEKSVPPPGDTP